MKLRNINSKKVVKAFIKMGLRQVRQNGTHVILEGNLNGEKKTLVIPIHHKEIPHGTLTAIINNQAKITREEFFKYY
jgi:predicted RNA binding protein YcfA (HicA-like mRNA interferase family)